MRLETMSSAIQEAPFEIIITCVGLHRYPNTKIRSCIWGDNKNLSVFFIPTFNIAITYAFKLETAFKAPQGNSQFLN